ncbi:MAG: MFS transporter [Pseudotabrizicola sp.]|uniref:MFS transporter n=1 Tax=Pseudotabrizicola sp. TaxID=2939647 RepID=UPI002730A7BB|nr:MFS transporter [Pseudotabrizicola sp.]MDP2081363.1 MFS transporter [Pseudotabrizicola sp.]MDZ7575248.1 MFS transporter [Pseudotabrizicola sp.]
MTSSATTSRREKAAVWALAFGQTLGYACFFYIFAALVLVWQRDLPWGNGVLALGPFLAIAVTAALSPQVGRWVDRGHALRLMGFGTVLGAASLAVLAVAWHPVVYLLAFVGLGAAASATLYEVCFALLIRRFADEARGPITRVTLVAGLASTLAFPAGAALAEAFGWRIAVWVAVAVVLCVMLPLQVWGAHSLGGGRVKGAPKPAVGASWRVILARPGVLGLMALFALLNLDHWMLVSLMRPLLAEMGISDGRAVTAAALIGPSQVLGRLALMAAGARLQTRMASQFTVLAMVAGPAFLLLSGGGFVLVLAFAAVQGAAMGILTILKPLLIAQINGSADYAASAAAISLPAMLATAVAPLLGTWIMGFGGPMTLVVFALALALGALGMLLRGQLRAS